MYKNLKYLIKNLGIRNKYLLVCIPIICAVVSMVFLLTNRVLYSSNINKAKEITSEECQIIGVQMDSMRKNVKSCLNIVTKDINQIYEDTNIENVNEVSFISVKNNIYASLDYNMRCFPEIDSIIFLDVKGNMVYIGENGEPNKELIKKEMLGEIPSKGIPLEIQYPVGIRTYMGTREPILCFGKRIISMNDGRNIGHIYVSISEKSISEILPDNESEEEVLGREYYIVDRDGRIVSAMNKDRLLDTVEQAILERSLDGKGSNVVKLLGEEYLITTEPLDGFQWTLVSQILMRDLTRDIKVASIITILCGCAGILIAVVLIWQLSNIIVRPLRILTQNTEQVQKGDFDIMVIPDTKDEVGVLASSFATMVKKINQLLIQVREEQQQKRKYELALIQEQIKPHFLYNTLDLIHVFCISNMSEKGADLTKVLADYYRGSLSNGKEIVSIAQEFDMVRNYLYIQKERYCDMLEFEVICDERIKAYSIVKMTLQPLVENAIYHGIKGREEKGRITVRGVLEMDAIIISVKDYGVGMTEERIGQILMEESSEYKEHFGLKSVDQRIKLYYGEEYGIEVKSKLGEGTIVLVRIPKQLEVGGEIWSG